jgi:hypothetical protein
MAETSEASSYQALRAASDADDDRWPIPQTAMLVTFASTGLWLLLLAGGRWLIG